MLLIQSGGLHLYLVGAMEDADPAIPNDESDGAGSDLARRLTRYRLRVEAEGRPRSLKLIDRAIEDADKKKPGKDSPP